MSKIFYDEDDGAAEGERPSPPAPLGWRIAGTTLKVLFWTFIITVNALLFWRMCSSGDPLSMRHIEGNKILADAYAAAEAKGEEALDSFGIKQSEHDDITDIKGKNYAYFGLTDSVLFPDAHQVQIVFRYNDSTLEHLCDDYGLGQEKLDKKLDWYDVTLRVLVDPTPDDEKIPAEGDCREIRLSASKTTPASKTLYSYRRLTYDNLPDIGSVVAVYVDIYYVGDINYDGEAYGTLCIYRAGGKTTPYDLGWSDVNAIKSASASAK